MNAPLACGYCRYPLDTNLCPECGMPLEASLHIRDEALHERRRVTRAFGVTMATTILGFVALPDHNWISLASGAVLLTLIMLYTLVTWLVWRRASARMVVRFGMLWVFFALGPRVLAGTMTVFTAGALLARMRVWF